MKFIQTPISGAFVIEPECHFDQRGLFARVFCKNEFEEHGLSATFVQCNLSFNEHRATIRGMHFQSAPHQEVKLVRCTSGRIFDAIIDLRRESPTFCRWFGIELSSDNRRMLYVPEGFAHGYLTLKHNTEVFYQVSQFYSPANESGVRWDDRVFDIRWPIPPQICSDKDRTYRSFAR